jgi:hypothetical protein
MVSFAMSSDMSTHRSVTATNVARPCSALSYIYSAVLIGGERTKKGKSALGVSVTL